MSALLFVVTTRIFDYFAVPDHDNSIGVLSHLRFVSDEHNGSIEFLV
jgi:hypothetical protein